MRHVESPLALMDTLARHWWMLAVRGVLAVALVVALLAWPDAMLDRVLLVFGAYAALDGMWTVVSAARLVRGGLPAWPVGLEGVVSLGLAGIALGWPLVPRDVVELIGVWGILTGILEITWARTLTVDPAFRGLLVTAGASSLFLGGFVLALPHAYVGIVMWAMAAYAGVFGAAILAAAWHSRPGLRGVGRTGPPPGTALESTTHPARPAVGPGADAVAPPQGRAR